MSIRSKRRRWQSDYSFRPRENNANFNIIQDERRWDLSPSYREYERGGWPTDEGRYRRNENVNPNQYQYYSGREDYPGPGRSQGFPNERSRRPYYGQSWNENNRQSGVNENYNDIRNLREYGYGSGVTETPGRRTWDVRGDESYNWGERTHEGNERRGEHRGKGPKGYKRLDERIREEVNDVLSDDEMLDASDIVVSVQDGEVSLSGTVCDRRSKRRAEDLVEEVSGVTNVENRIRIGKVTPEEPISGDDSIRHTTNPRSRSLTG